MGCHFLQATHISQLAATYFRSLHYSCCSTGCLRSTACSAVTILMNQTVLCKINMGVSVSWDCMVQATYSKMILGFLGRFICHPASAIHYMTVSEQFAWSFAYKRFVCPGLVARSQLQGIPG